MRKTPSEFIKTKLIYNPLFLYTITVYTLFSLLTILQNLYSLSTPPCGKKIRSSIITFLLSSLIFIYLSIIIAFFKIKPNYKQIKYMECNLFYVLTLLMVLSGGVTVVVLIWGEIDALFIFYYFGVFECVGFLTFFEVVTIYGSFNLSFVYLVFLTIFEVFKIMRVRKEFDFVVLNCEERRLVCEEDLGN